MNKFYYIMDIIFIIIILILIYFSLSQKVRDCKRLKTIYKKIEDIASNHHNILLFILFTLMIFTSIYKLGEVPYGMHVDEAGMAYDAYCIANYGVDRYLNRFPIYLINYGGGQSAMYSYLASILIKIFGYSIQIIRLPSVALRILCFISCFYIIRNDNSKLKNIIFLFLLSITPYFIMQSRWGLDCNLLVGFMTIGISFFINSILRNNKLILFLSGFFFGLSLYTYALSYIIIPILLLFICVYSIYIKKMNIKDLIIFGVPIILLAIPLMLMILVNNNVIDEINWIITIPQLKEYRGSEISLSNIFKNIYIFISIFSIDKDPILVYNSIPYFGTIYYFAIPFFLIGFIQGLKKLKLAFKNKKFEINSIFVFWFFSVLICQLVILDPNINKANAIFVPILYFITTGIFFVCKKKKEILIPIVLIFILNFMLFFNYYYYHYNEEHNNQFFFSTYYSEAIKFSKELGKSYVFIENDLTAQEYIYILLDNSISPYEYKENNIVTTSNNKTIVYILGIPEKINIENVYIVGSNENTLKKFENYKFEYKKFGGLTVFYNENC